MEDERFREFLKFLLNIEATINKATSAIESTEADKNEAKQIKNVLLEAN
jgi:hypothetical protein